MFVMYVVSFIHHCRWYVVASLSSVESDRGRVGTRVWDH